MAKLTFILGGARSGKSAYAEERALSQALDPVYIATAESLDQEMAERIADHKQRRAGKGWLEIEAPLDLAGALGAAAATGRVVLVDCLTLWLTNLMAAGRDEEAAGAELVRIIAPLPGEVILISNEVGLGIVPDNALARTFRDAAGRLHQRVAAQADTVVLMVAGLPHVIKS